MTMIGSPCSSWTIQSSCSSA